MKPPLTTPAPAAWLDADFATFVEVLVGRTADRSPDEIFWFPHEGEDGERYSYARLGDETRALAAALQSQLEPGARALMLYPPGSGYTVSVLACMLAGVVAVPAYPPDVNRLNRTVPRLLALIHDSRAAIVLTTSELRDAIEQFLRDSLGVADLPVVATDAAGTTASPEDWRDPEIDPDTVAILQYTSGSTSEPRGVELTHGNLIANSIAIAHCFGHTPESRGVIWLPPYHDMGLIGGNLQPLFCGLSTCLISPLTFLRRPLRWLEAVSDYRGTTSGGPNFAYAMCVRRTTPEQREQLDLSSWRLAFNGAEPIRRDTIEEFSEAFAVSGFRKEAFYPCYGLAESTLIVSGGKEADAPRYLDVDRDALGDGRVERVPDDAVERKTLVSCGEAIPDSEIAIVDPDTHERCEPGRVGEIWIAGPCVARGYWERPEETEATFEARTADGDGPFLRTGDLGFLDGAELYVTGRSKEVLIVRGRNYDPIDIEGACEAAAPELRRSCGAAFTIAVADDDGIDGVDGERVVVVYELDDKSERPPADVIATMRKAVSQAVDLQLGAVVLIAPRTIPKTSSGKLQRRLCRQEYIDGQLDVRAEWSLAGGPAD